MKNILITGLIITLFCGNSFAGVGSDSGYSFDGNGLPEYPNEGSMWASCYGEYWSSAGSSSGTTETYSTSGNYMHYHSIGYGGYCTVYPSLGKSGTSTTGTAAGAFYEIYGTDTGCVRGSGTEYLNTTSALSGFAYIASTGTYGSEAYSGDSFIRVTITKENVYNVSGTTNCLSLVELYYEGNKIDEDDNLTAANSYEFIHLIDGKNYTLNFSDGHEYEFTVNGADTTYNYDACIKTLYRFEESCGNLIPDSEGYYTEYEAFWVTAWDFYEPSGILDILDSSAIKIAVHTDTFIGNTGWVIDPIVNDTTYTLVNPNIAWWLKVIVQNESDGSLIDGAMVRVEQDCYCTAGYSTRQKMTVSGMTEFGDMSLQDASLFVMASGYKILDENNTGYEAFLSGRTNFSGKTWLVKLAPSTSNNTSTFYEPKYKTDIHFKNEDGNRTSQILDTDSEVYLYYENNNSENEAMTLKFQSSSTHSYFIDEDSWTIAHDDIGHKTIPQSDFIPWTYAYRAVLYNSSIYGWNITIPLTVKNETKEETIHYENLTTNLWFRHESDGKIDYREDMQIVSHARSDNTTLMNIDLEVWKDGAILCYTNLTESDYENADFPYFFVYEPVYNYVVGSNYTIKMYGFDRTLLEVRYLDCISDNITRKNKLTIIVKDKSGANLNNAFVYLEGYGSLPTGNIYYAAYEGLDAGYYRFKATKPDYVGSGWSDVTLTDGDQIVTYTLSESTDPNSVASQQTKSSDEDMKSLYLTLMFFLLCFILFGGVMYVIK